MAGSLAAVVGGRAVDVMVVVGSIYLSPCPGDNHGGRRATRPGAVRYRGNAGTRTMGLQGRITFGRSKKKAEEKNKGRAQESLECVLWPQRTLCLWWRDGKGECRAGQLLWALAK